MPSNMCCAALYGIGKVVRIKKYGSIFKKWIFQISVMLVQQIKSKERKNTKQIFICKFVYTLCSAVKVNSILFLQVKILFILWG